MKLPKVIVVFILLSSIFLICFGYSWNPYRWKNPKPHIVFVLLDDLGWSDIGYHNPDIISPNLDKLANNGIKLDNYYVQPTCTPSRGQLLSGRHLHHLGFQHINIKPMQPTGLPTDSPLLPEKLRDSGYSTHLVGKWHLGHSQKKYLPTERGFDSFYGFLTGSSNHYTHRRCFEGFCGLDLWNNTEPDLKYKGRKTYSTYLFTKKSAQIVKNHNPKKPMFLMLSLQAVHEPLKVPLKYKEKYKDSRIPPGKRRRLAAMVTCVDESIGYLVQMLKRRAMWKNTVFVFSTDNGGSISEGSSNWPLRGEKGRYWEGGVRGVGFVYSKLLRRRGRKLRELMHITDWYPTFVGLAGGNLKGTKRLAGFNQWRTISYGVHTKRKEILFNIDPCSDLHGERLNGTEFDTRVKSSIRLGVWKVLTGRQGRGHWFAPAYERHLIMKDTQAKENNVWMFNIAKDPLEQKDLSKVYPRRLKLILDRLAYHNKTSRNCTHPPNDILSVPYLNDGMWGPWL